MWKEVARELHPHSQPAEAYPLDPPEVSSNPSSGAMIPSDWRARIAVIQQFWATDCQVAAKKCRSLWTEPIHAQRRGKTKTVGPTGVNFTTRRLLSKGIPAVIFAPA